MSRIYLRPNKLIIQSIARFVSSVHYLPSLTLIRERRNKNKLNLKLRIIYQMHLHERIYRFIGHIAGYFWLTDECFMRVANFTMKPGLHRRC